MEKRVKIVAEIDNSDLAFRPWFACKDGCAIRQIIGLKMDLPNITPKIRGDLLFFERPMGDEQGWIVKDPIQTQLLLVQPISKLVTEAFRWNKNPCRCQT